MRRAIVLFAGAVLAFASLSHAAILATTTKLIQIDVSYSPGPYTLEYSLHAGELYGPFDHRYRENRIFDDIKLSADKVGTTFTVTRENDPHFDYFASRLTDGSNDHIYAIELVTGATGWREEAGSWRESSFLWLTDGHDLAGYDLTAVNMHLDSLTASGGSFFGFVTFSFEGTPVPEPTCLGVFATATFGLLRRRRIASC